MKGERGVKGEGEVLSLFSYELAFSFIRITPGCEVRLREVCVKEERDSRRMESKEEDIK